ncbi:hypothetical protein OHS58_03740 [Amycolatopsis sp. NBC_00348]|uniref:hypothetical protein n=1 Tax=Amycolatopsis sp. NBC_00348 TaxID=2975956 RepID=UPI002E2589C6
MRVHLPISLALKLAAVLLLAGLFGGFCLAASWQAPAGTALGPHRSVMARASR